MAVDVDICNSALKKIKAARITAIEPSDGSTNANSCAEVYPRLRDVLLESHDWNFAMTRVKLAQSVTAPVFGPDRKFALPADWLRTVRVWDNDEEMGAAAYTEEAGFLVSDATDLWLRYVQLVTDVNRMPHLFREALAFSLAVELAIDLKNSRTLSETMERRFKTMNNKAKSKDAKGEPSEGFPDPSWVTARQ